MKFIHQNHPMKNSLMQANEGHYCCGRENHGVSES
jgi:hypothetical protein